MPYERLETLKDSDKSKVYLVYDSERRCMAVEKHLRGEQKIYSHLAELDHSFLPKIYEVQYKDDETRVVEEYISGGSVALLNAGEKQLTRWLLELCDVLTFLHRNGILHRDIKPSNLLLGEDGHIRLIDFDAAREEKSEAESDTRLLGTRGYAPPEQYGFAQTDERADIYALGVTFRELLGAASKKLRWRHILSRCTAMEPKRRYSHVRSIKLAVLLGKVRRRALYPLCTLLLAVTIGFTLWSYFGDADFRSAMDIVLSSRRGLVFDSVDMTAIRRSDVQLAPFDGDAAEIYRRMVAARPEEAYISTGYCTVNGCLLFGGFTETYYIDTGERYYGNFTGLYYIDKELYRIVPEDCSDYAPAVLALYGLDVFDTPLT